MGRIDEIPCPACHETYARKIKFIEDAKELQINCNDCGYEWKIPAFDESVFDIKDDDGHYRKRAKVAEEKAFGLECAIKAITNVMIDKIIWLADDE